MALSRKSTRSWMRSGTGSRRMNKRGLEVLTAERGQRREGGDREAGEEEDREGGNNTLQAMTVAAEDLHCLGTASPPCC
eukprot:977932-Rhodomonas_salina.1